MELKYEYLLRGIYQSSRNNKTGADADIYRAMEHAHYDLTTKSMFKTQEEREYEFRKLFAEVREYIRKALNDGMDKIKPYTSPEEMNLLEKFRSKLTFDFCNKEELDHIIDEAGTIFSKHGFRI